jgi:hypothetical protein
MQWEYLFVFALGWIVVAILVWSGAWNFESMRRQQEVQRWAAAAVLSVALMIVMQGAYQEICLETAPCTASLGTPQISFVALDLIVGWAALCCFARFIFVAFWRFAQPDRRVA